MKVQYVSICPTEKAIEENCYAFTPELLASVGARYSRNNEGLDSIASKIDKKNLEKSVDSIFRMIDYGHASIADMTPISLFIDDISQFAAYYLWTLSPTAGGQECSTRYLKMDSSSLISGEELGIPPHLIKEFDHYNQKCFTNYQIALEAWDELSKLYPENTKIPENLLNSELEKDIKVVSRMRRNYSFDRARIFVPLATSTGVMMIQSARAWSGIASHLQSHYLLELKNLGKKIAEALSIGAPRLLKHSNYNESISKFIEQEKLFIQNASKSNSYESFKYELIDDVVTQSILDTQDLNYSNELVADSCKHRVNRYSPFGNIISRTVARFGWLGISFGEIRDLNRHRTGTKYCPLIPLGFYSAIDQLPADDNEISNVIKKCSYSMVKTAEKARELLNQNIGEYIYFTSLGHQYYFEHVTTADKFLYEMELRTGVGAHYKYAEHCKDVLKLWYDKYPETKYLLFEGTAEPE